MDSLHHGDPTPGEPVASGPRPFEESPPFEPRGPLRWAMLWIAPARFFAGMRGRHRPFLSTFAMIIAGMAAIADRLDSARLAAELRGDPSPAASQQATWLGEWLTIVFFGFVAGLFIYGIGGEWHRLRLRFCAVRKPDPILSRQVYITARLVFAIPMLIAVVALTATYASPDEAYHDGPWLLDFGLLATAFWASLSNYHGVRATFDVRRGRAIFWFVALPWAWYTTLVVVFGALFFFATPDGSASLTPRPFRAATWSFDHPVGWPIDTEQPGYDPARFLRIVAHPDGWIEIERYHSTVTPREEIAVTLDAYAVDFGPMRDASAFTEWAGLSGVGRVAIGQWEGLPLKFRVFATALDDGEIFEVREGWLVRDEDAVQPGFEMIRSSFSLRISPVPVAPDAPPSSTTDPPY
ncbi:MAG: hypothetical protein ACF8QF_01740 [Phycisphaerales bacterium]